MATHVSLSKGLAQSSDFQMDGKFTGKKKDADSGRPASNLSGAACMPARADGSRLCLVIDDETRHAQFASVRDGAIQPGSVLKLFGKDGSEATVGVPPDASLFDAGEDFGEMDGEAVAYAEPYFYVTGSHGFSRKKGKFVVSQFMLARIRVDGEGRPAGKNGRALPEARWEEAVETTYRLSNVLADAKGVGAYFAKDLGENGLNIEGLAVIGGKLVAALRAPVLGGEAYLLTTDIEPLFAPGHEPTAKPRSQVTPVALGKDTGFRELAPLSDGRLLVLAGPAQEQSVPYRLFLLEPKPGAKPVLLTDIETPETPEGERSRAEALIVLDEGPERLRVLVFFDGIPNGGATELDVALPGR
jgi:hypothetical protein